MGCQLSRSIQSREQLEVFASAVWLYSATDSMPTHEYSKPTPKCAKLFQEKSTTLRVQQYMIKHSKGYSFCGLRSSLLCVGWQLATSNLRPPFPELIVFLLLFSCIHMCGCVLHFQATVWGVVRTANSFIMTTIFDKTAEKYGNGINKDKNDKGSYYTTPPNSLT